MLVYIIGAFLSALSAFFYIPDTFSLTSLLCTLLYIIIAMKKPIEQRFFFVAIAIPNTRALCIGPISGAICICALTVCLDFLRKGRKYSISGLVFIYFVYSFQLLFRSGVNEGLIMPLKMCLALFFFDSLSSNRNIRDNSFVYGFKASLSLLIGIIFAFIASVFNLESIGRLAVAGNDSNILAVEIAFVVAYLCVFYYSSNVLKQYIFFTLLGSLCLVSLLCGSRMGLLLIVFSLISSVLLNISRMNKSICLIIGSVILLFFLATSDIGRTAIALLRYRSELLELQGDSSNGRFDIWDQYIGVLNDNPIRWFLGLGNFKNYGIENQAHNFLLEDIGGYGIVGTSLLYFTIYKILRRQFIGQNIALSYSRRIFNYLPILIPIIGGITLHGLTSIINLTMLYIGTLALSKSKHH